jgi:hypothetical protein
MGHLGFVNPVSHGAAQQMVVDAKPGVYVLACGMQTQDGRLYTGIGMVRMIRITR